MLFLGLILFFACSEKEDGPSERFKILTTTTWESDSLLVNNEDASGPGQILENFKGDVIFNPDGTGTFGMYNGSWSFQSNETQIVIVTEWLPIAITTIIEELTAESLKIFTAFPSQTEPGVVLNIRMTFKAK